MTDPSTSDLDPLFWLPQIEEALRLATPGPWQLMFGEPSDAPAYAVSVVSGYVCAPTDDHDANLIVLLRNHAAALCTLVRSLQAERDEARSAIDGFEALLLNVAQLRARVLELEGRIANALL